MEFQELDHAFGREHVLLVDHDGKVAAADVRKVVLAPLLVLLVNWFVTL